MVFLVEPLGLKGFFVLHRSSIEQLPTAVARLLVPALQTTQARGGAKVLFASTAPGRYGNSAQLFGTSHNLALGFAPCWGSIPAVLTCGISAPGSARPRAHVRVLSSKGCQLEAQNVVFSPSSIFQSLLQAPVADRATTRACHIGTPGRFLKLLHEVLLAASVIRLQSAKHWLLPKTINANSPVRLASWG